jgi:hypothetical protein
VEQCVRSWRCGMRARKDLTLLRRVRSNLVVSSLHLSVGASVVDRWDRMIIVESGGHVESPSLVLVINDTKLLISSCQVN